MKKGDFLFVYGTLRLGESADLSRTGKALFVESSKIDGDLYNLGWFPGVKLGTGNTVKGDLFLIEDESITPQLDRYEGHPTLFCRKQIGRRDDGDVWVYEYNGPVKAELRLESGDWQTEAR